MPLPSPDGRRLPWAWILGPVALAYLPILRGALTGDDVDTVLREDASTTWGHALAQAGGLHGRPLFWMSLAADRSLWGLHPAGFHLTGLLLHLGCTALLASLAGVLGGRRCGTAAGLLFGLHPLASSAVCYVSERTGLLVAAAALGVLRLLCAAAGSPRPRPLLAAAATVWILGCLSKESAAMIPFCALALLPVLPQGPGRGAVRAWTRAACLAATALGGWYLWLALDPGPRLDHPSTGQYVLMAPRALATYARLWLLPFHQALIRDVPPATVRGALAGALAVLAGLAVLARLPGARGGLLAALLALLPETSVIPLVDPVAEYRMYLPAAFLALAAAPALAFLAARPAGRRAALGLAFAAALLTTARAAGWGSETGLWQEALRTAPRRLLVNANLARLYWKRALQRQEAGDARGAPALFEAAERMIRRAVHIRSRPGPWRDLAMIAWQRGEDTKGMAALAEAFRIEPDRPDCLPLLGLFHMRAGRWDEARSAFERARAGRPDDPELPALIAACRRRAAAP